MADLRATVTGPSTATITWTARGARGWVEVGRDEPFGLWYPAHARRGRFTARLSGLAPLTAYQFRVLTDRAASAVGSIRTSWPAAHTRATTDSGRILLDGQAFFPLMVWAQCPDGIDRSLALGVNLVMGSCYALPDDLLLAGLRGRAYAVLPAENQASGLDGQGLIGWNYRDEPDRSGVSAHDLPRLEPAASSGRLRVLTATHHFFLRSSLLPPARLRQIYAPYFERADVVGFDLYPLEKLCGDTTISLRTDYEAQRELSRIYAQHKPTFQWIETGPLDGECAGSRHPVTPATVRAEAWLAIAGGATGLGWFTHTFIGPWRRFDVEPDVEAEIGRTNAEITALAPGLLGTTELARVKRGRPVVVGARGFDGAVYVVAVNPAYATVSATVDVPVLRSSTFSVFGERRTVEARDGVFSDTFAPLAVHVYVAAPRGESSSYDTKP